MSARTDDLLFDFADPLKAALDLVRSERLNTELVCALNPALRRWEVKNFQRSMWLRDRVSDVVGQCLVLAATMPPAMIYVETADVGKTGFAGERLLDDARLEVVPCDLVLHINGLDYSVVDVSTATNAGSSALSPQPGIVVNPGFVRWRQRAMAWQQKRFKRQQQFLAACHLMRRSPAIIYKVDIKAGSTVAGDAQAESIDDLAQPLSMTNGAAPATVVTSSLAERKTKTAGHIGVRELYLAWLREQSQPPSYGKRLEKLKALALEAGWRADGPVRSTLQQWEKMLRE
jgi:hypothetical protein